MSENRNPDLLNRLPRQWNAAGRREFFTRAGSGLAIALAPTIDFAMR